MRVYIAADYARKAEVRQYADELEGLGIVCTSRWCRIGDDAEGGVGSTADDPLWAHQMAQMDLEDVRGSDALVQLTTGNPSRGGRQVELGAALWVPMPVLVVGPREHVFHWHRSVLAVEDWAGALPVLRDWREGGPAFYEPLPI